MPFGPFTRRTDNVDDIMAAHINELQAAIEKISGSVALTVASNDAPALIKARCDYLCDGVADNVQIQAALDASYHVILSQGHFHINAPIWVVKHGTVFEGSGWGNDPQNAKESYGTFLILDTTATGINANFNTDVGTANLHHIDEAIVIVGGATADAFSVDAKQRTAAGEHRPRTRVNVKNMAIHGNSKVHGKNTTDVHGIIFASNFGRLQDVFVTSTSGDAFRCEGSMGMSDQLYETMMFGLQAEKCDGWGLIGYAGAGDAHCLHSVFQECGLGGISSSAAWQLDDIQVYNNGGPGVDISNRGVRLTNFKVETNNKGIYIHGNASTVLIESTGFQNNCDSDNANDWLDIHVEEVNDCLISGCMFDSIPSHGTRYSKHNIYVGAAANRVTITSCHVDGQTRAVTDTNADGIPDANHATTKSPAIEVAGGSNSVRITDVGGFRTENRGSTLITAAPAGVAIAHGLGTHRGATETLDTAQQGIIPEFISANILGTAGKYATVTHSPAPTVANFTVQVWNADGTQATTGNFTVNWFASKTIF